MTTQLDEWYQGSTSDSLVATYFASKEYTSSSATTVTLGVDTNTSSEYENWFDQLSKITFGTTFVSGTQFPSVYYTNFRDSHGVDCLESKYTVGPGFVTTAEGTQTRNHFGVPQIWLRRVDSNTLHLNFIDDNDSSILTQLNLSTNNDYLPVPSGITLDIVEDFYVPYKSTEFNIKGSYTISGLNTENASTRSLLSPDNTTDTRKLQTIVLTKTNHGISMDVNPMPLITWLDEHPSVPSDESPEITDRSGSGYLMSRYEIHNGISCASEMENIITASDGAVDAYSSNEQRLKITVTNNNYSLNDRDSIDFHTSVYPEQDPREFFEIGSTVKFTSTDGAGFTNEGFYIIRDYFVDSEGDIIMSVDGNSVSENSVEENRIQITPVNQTFTIGENLAPKLRISFNYTR